MTCNRLELPGGGVAIVCTRGRRRRASCSHPGCTREHSKLCDYPLRGARAGETCDAKLCSAHATSVGEDRDYCPAHAKLPPPARASDHILSMASEGGFDPHLVARDTVVDQLDNATQLRLAEQARAVVRQSPLVRPRTPNGMAMRIMVSAAGALGWVGDGAYRYDSVDSRGKPWPALPEEWAAIADRVAGRHPWDSAIINWYPPGSSLGWHRDIHEADRTLPIVTISLGDACSWAIRADEASPVCRCRLETGHVTLLAGEKRLWLHTVERVIPAPMFSPLGTRTRGRLSITIRVAGGAG